MTGKPGTRRAPAAAPPAAAGEPLDESALPATQAELAHLRAELAELAERVEEHEAVLATRLERRRRRIDHPRLYPDGSTHR